MKTQSNELKEYVNASLAAIKYRVANSGFRLTEPIEFSVAVTNISEGAGGLKIHVVNAEGKLRSEEVSHIKFKVRPGLGYSISENHLRQRS